jgi:ABC-type branched-subunit amino acid transport system ATPase component
MESDIIIAVMGIPGVGKSTFIKNITGNDDLVIGHGLFSGTPVNPKTLILLLEGSVCMLTT